jgi:2-amino-4-hydroxy-6-hydroxymethyldihydropteridine diphosphokinase
MTTEQSGAQPVRSVLAFGSNLGERDDTIIDAVAELGRVAGIEVVALSSLYETVAVKPHGLDERAPRYLNAAAVINTRLAPHELLSVLNGIEHSHGRVRDERWGDRTLDIDVITYGSLEQSDETLTLPHPRAWQRDFVLAPWLEIEPDAVLPGHGPVAALLAATADTARPTTRES